MKVLALSDEVVPLIYSPQVREHFADVDLILGCGDVPYYYLEYVVSMLDRPLYYVHGNHDIGKQYKSDGRVAERAEGCTVLDGRVAQHGGLLLGGLGGSVRYRPDAPNQYSQPEMTGRMWRMALQLWINRLQHGRCLDVLFTHSPPFGIHDQPDPAHVGFRAFLAFMQRFEPRYLLHGHCHVRYTSEPQRTRFHKTDVLNIYPYRLLELSGPAAGG
jgi:Icc-related predicted phosphoesterase